LGLGASASIAAEETSGKTQDAESAECASAETGFDSSSDTLRNRDRLALLAGLPVSFRESNGRKENALASNETARTQSAPTISRPQNDSWPEKLPLLPYNMTVTIVLIWRVSCFISNACSIALQFFSRHFQFH